MFDKDFIGGRGIKTITGQVSIKRDNEIIQETALFIYYRFDRNGRMVEKKEYRQIGRRFDTTVVHYHYNPAGQLDHMVKNDAIGWVVKCYRFNGLGALESVRLCRVDQPWVSRDHSSCNHTIWKDSVTTDEQGRTYYNDAGRPYKTERISHYDDGSFKQREVRYRRGGNFSVMTCKLDASNKIIERAEMINGKEFRRRWDQVFNETGTLAEMLVYRDDEVTERRVFSYHPDQTLDFELRRDPAKKEIRIIKYRYKAY